MAVSRMVFDDDDDDDGGGGGGGDERHVLPDVEQLGPCTHRIGSRSS